MNVSKVLETKGSADVLTVAPTASLREFARKACSVDVGALLVTGPGGETLGIISERDLFRRVSAGGDLDRMTVAEAMTRNVISVEPTDDVHKAMDLMVSKGVRHLPVMASGTMHGFITVRDIMRAMRKAEEDDIQHLIHYLQDNMATENTSL